MKFEYSNTINIKVKEIEVAKEDVIISVYPNPTNGLLNIVYQAVSPQNVVLNVFNVIGQNMANQSVSLTSGIHTLNVNAADFAAGVYVLSLQNTSSGKKMQTKFVKE